MTEDGIKKLQECRKTILLSEIGALIHDVGKLNDFFVKKQSIEGEGDPLLKNYRHGDILEYDSNEQHSDFYPGDNALKQKAKQLKNLLEALEVDYNGKCSNLYLFIKSHHCKTEEKEKECPNDFVRLLHDADTRDAAEDRNKAPDRQSICKTYYSSAFGYEKAVEVDYKAERTLVYDYIRDILDTCDIDKIKRERRAFLAHLKESFNRALGMTARAANDVSLWEHSYMTASIMKALLSQCIMENKFPDVKGKGDIETEKPFKICSIGWDFFAFVSQSHKIPDVVGRINVLNAIKEELKNMIETEFLLGNCIYDDDHGLHFLVPAAFDDERVIKDTVFAIFNTRTNGVLIPHVKLTDTCGKLTELLPYAMGALEREIRRKSINDFVPKWTREWMNGMPRKKLICRVCGKGFYCEGNEEICETCNDIRDLGRGRKSPETIFVEEVAWNGEEYEDVALVVLNFDLRNWFNKKCVKSLFVRDPNNYKKEIFDLYEYLYYKHHERELKEIYNLIRRIRIQTQDYIENSTSGNKTGLKNLITQLMKKDNQNTIYLITTINKKKNLDISITKFQSLLELKPEDFNDQFLDDVIPEFVKINPTIQLSGEVFLSGQEANQVTELIFGKVNLTIPREIYKAFMTLLDTHEHKNVFSEQKSKKGPEEFWELIVQKTPSPSRLMRVWNNTNDFFDTVSTSICERSRVIERCVLGIGKSLGVDRRAWEVEIGAEGKKENGEVVFDGKNCITVTPHVNAFIEDNGQAPLKITVTDKDWTLDKNALLAGFTGKRSVRGYRTISISPTMFMFLAPASQVFESLLAIKSRYIERFGKVYGKLPLHIGVVYFKRKMPFFVVLDSARRYIDCFKVKKAPLVKEIKEIERNKINTDIGTIELPYKRGDGETDKYHPYIMVTGGENTIRMGGAVTEKHILSLEKGDEIKIQPSVFDFQFLDTNTRRFDIVLNKETKKRRHDIVGEEGPRPYLLEDIEQFRRMKEIFEAIGSWTPIMDIEALAASKRQEWGEDGVLNDKEAVYEELIDAALANKIALVFEDKETWEKDIKPFLLKRIVDGSFFDAIELFKSIMKLKL